MKYVIRIGYRTDNNSTYQWSYYNSHTYQCKGEYFVDDFFDINKAKRYSSKKTAEKVAEQLYDKCVNVDVWLIEEVEE